MTRRTLPRLVSTLLLVPAVAFGLSLLYPGGWRAALHDIRHFETNQELIAQGQVECQRHDQELARASEELATIIAVLDSLSVQGVSLNDAIEQTLPVLEANPTKLRSTQRIYPSENLRETVALYLIDCLLGRLQSARFDPAPVRDRLVRDYEKMFDRPFRLQDS
jgi:hypothetical protein